ncbi:MAG: hypothetical protein LBT59_10115 [Clostridiales bacterium]|nr:hypothetical protein [Clostridiales bacterium]
MVIYYSSTGRTKAAAEELAKLKGTTAFELRLAKPLGKAVGAVMALLKKAAPLLASPDISKEPELYLCSPVWAGQMTPAMRQFIAETNFTGKTVSVLLTCAAAEGHERYKLGVLEALSGKGAAIGFVLVFASPKEGFDRETLREHLTELT